MSNAVVKSDRYTVDPLYQWDKDQVLTIYGLSLPSIPEIHFTNTYMDKAIVKQSTMDDAGIISVNIPNSLLQNPYKITAYICIYEGETFKTLYSLDIPVKPRKKPADYTLELDDEVYSFRAMENRIENLASLIADHNGVDEELIKKYVNLGNELEKKYNETAERVNTSLDGFSKDLGYLKTYVTPQMFGAKGDGETDDTEALNKMLSSSKRIVFENGVYIISDSLTVNSDSVIELKNAKIISTTTAEKKYIFHIDSKSNIKILGDNSSLIMLKPTTAQQANIGIFNSDNICIDGLKLTRAGGDGILIGGSDTIPVSDVDIGHCIIDDSRRNGISLVGGIDGLSIHDCIIKNTSGTSPQLGIDIETWTSSYLNKNISIYNNRFENNANGSLTIFEYTDGVKVYNNHFDGVVSAKVNTQYNGVIEANPTNLSFYNNIFEASLYFYGVDYGGFDVQGNIFNGSMINIESPITVTLDETAHSKSKLVKGNTFNNPTSAMMIGCNANLIICDNVVNNCRMFLSAWSLFKSVIKGNLVNGYNVNGDKNRIIEFNGKINNLIIENNTIIANAETNSIDHIIYFKGGSAFGNICRNNNLTNAEFTTPVGYDARNDNFDYCNSTPDCDNFCSALPPASKKFAGTIVSIVGQTSVFTYVCTGANGSYSWKELTL